MMTIKKTYRLAGLILGMTVSCAFANANIPSPATSGLPNPQSSDQTINRIVAVVNNGIITQSELDAAIARTKEQLTKMHSRMPSEEQIRQGVLNQLIFQKLQLQIAKRNKMKATNEQINAAIGRIAKQSGITVEQLKQKVAKEGVRFSQFRKDLKKQIIISQIQQQAVSREVNVTADDINTLKQKIAAQQGGGTQYHIADIIVPVASDASDSTWKAAEATAQSVKQQLQKGASITDAIAQHKNAQYSNLSWGTINSIPDLFSAQLPNMKIGGVAGPLKAGNGYHVIKLEGTRGKATKMPSKAQLQQIAYRQKFQVALEKWLMQLRKTSYVKIED